MVRKRIPLVTRTDPAYSASLLREDIRQTDLPAPTLPKAQTDDTAAIQDAREPAGPPHVPASPVSRNDPSTQIDVRVTALARQEAALCGCGIAPAQVVRAALRRAVKRWQLVPDYVPPAKEGRARDMTWTARTSVAVPAAVFDRLQADQDPLGVCSRWSLVRGQLEPLIWEEIDALLVSLESDNDDA